MTTYDTSVTAPPGAATDPPEARATSGDAQPGAAAPIVVDLAETSVTELNEQLHAARGDEAFLVRSPAGRHNLAVGIDSPIEVTIEGHAGYYCAGMHQTGTVRVTGNAAVGCAENMMSGLVEVQGNAGQAAAATAHGGLLLVRGDAAARCGISLKGADIVVEGSVGHMTGFLSQRGRIVVCGDAGDALGDSLFETRIYVAGSVKSLGADCIEKELRPEHVDELRALLAAAGRSDLEPERFRRYGSARTLYHFTADRVEAT